MKKIQLVLLLVSVLIMVACGSEGGIGQAVDNLLSCKVDANKEYAQSEKLACVETFRVGSPEFQVGDAASSVRFSLDSARIYTLSSLLQEWDILANEEVAPCSEGEACYHKFLTDYGRIHVDETEGYVGFSSNGRLYLDRTATDNLLYESSLFDDGGLEIDAYIGELDMFASYNSQVIHFYDRATGKFTFDLAFDPFEIEEVAGGKNSYAVSFSNASPVFVFFTDASREGLVIEGHEATVIRMKYSPDGSRLATFDQDGLLIIWDTSNGEEVFRQMFEPDELFKSTIGDAYKPALELAISPDNQLLVARGDTDRTVSIWSLKSGEIIAEFESNSLVYDMDISPNGRYLATVNATTGVYDGNARDCNSGGNNGSCSNSGTLSNGAAVVYDISELVP